MANVNPYITFNGNCEEAFDFYKSVFGGEIQQISRYKDMPPMKGHPKSESANEKIMHISLPLSKETSLMGCDSNPEYGNVNVGENISLSISTDNKSDADKIFNRLSQGGRVTMPMADTFWNSYFGMLTDKYNINWMVSSFDKPVEEQKTRQRETTSAHG